MAMSYETFKKFMSQEDLVSDMVSDLLPDLGRDFNDFRLVDCFEVGEAPDIDGCAARFVYRNDSWTDISLAICLTHIALSSDLANIYHSRAV